MLFLYAEGGEQSAPWLSISALNCSKETQHSRWFAPENHLENLQGEQLQVNGE